MANRPTWTPEAVGHFWDRYANDPRNVDVYFAKKFGTGITNILRTAVSTGRVLDYGCGPGFLSRRLLDAGFSVQGVDSSSESRRAADERCRGTSGWLGAVPDAAEIDAESFDAVTCVETIEHLDDEVLSTVLSSIRRLLGAHGVALFTTPNAEVLEESFVYCPFCDSEFHAVQHVRSWDAATLRTSLEASGFTVETCGPTDLGRWQPFRESQWLGVRRSAGILLRRVRPRGFDGGPHLIAVARRA